MKKYKVRHKVLAQYLFMTYLIALFNGFEYLGTVKYINLITGVFEVSAYLTYCLFYLLPIYFLLLTINRFLSLDILEKLSSKVSVSISWIVYTFAVIGFSLVQVLIFSDRLIHNLYGFHINGFVWNIVFTPGGIKSLGGGSSTTISFILIILGIFIVQAAVLILVLKVKKIQSALKAVFTRPVWVSLKILFVLMALFQGITYGVSDLLMHTPVLAAAESLPLYQPFTFSRFAKSMGFKPVRNTSFRMKVDESLKLNYPLCKINTDPNHKNYNIVWLVAESLRFDMLDAEIMPATWNFAQRCNWFKNHYSGGNGTRMGMFSMFYGIYGNYWFSFLENQQGPVLMDILIKNGYQFDMFTSAKFTYPELDGTIFARIPKSQLHEYNQGIGWECDRYNVTQLLNFVANRDASKPFMTFMFFESPHAKYYFPEENTIRKDYLKDLNYATMDLEKDVGLIKNRYINSCNHLDSQFARIINYLEENNLLDSTIVLITGDHGEEFMEKGRWGHNSAFTEEQVRPPLVLWVPGKSARQVTDITSHLDIPATLLGLFGVTNSPQDYSLGYDLFGLEKRQFTIVSGWDHLAYVDPEYKAVFPLKGYSFAQQSVTTKNDAGIEDKDSFYNKHKTLLLQIMKDLSKYSRIQGDISDEKAPPHI